MRVLAQLPLSPREKLVLVEVGDKQMLLGVSSSSINQLHVFDQPVILKNEASSSEFHRAMLQFLNKESKP
jgi:flagellar protein FliO/FliZ